MATGQSPHVSTPMLKVEEEICSEDVSCYTGSLRPFKDLLVFPEDVNFSGLVELLERHEVTILKILNMISFISDRPDQNEDHHSCNHYERHHRGFLT